MYVFVKGTGQCSMYNSKLIFMVFSTAAFRRDGAPLIFQDFSHRNVASVDLRFPRRGILFFFFSFSLFSLSLYHLDLDLSLPSVSPNKEERGGEKVAEASTEKKFGNCFFKSVPLPYLYPERSRSPAYTIRQFLTNLVIFFQ